MKRQLLENRLPCDGDAGTWWNEQNKEPVASGPDFLDNRVPGFCSDPVVWRIARLSSLLSITRFSVLTRALKLMSVGDPSSKMTWSKKDLV